MFFFPLTLLAQTETQRNRSFDWGGDMFVQSFFLNRDLPLARPEELERPQDRQYEPVCPPPNPRPAGLSNSTNSRCREEVDFTFIRFRVDFAIRPSPIADVHFGLEVGNLIYGREPGTSGPGSGGRGSGRTNLETRELFLRLHNASSSQVIDTGILTFSTPNGMVLAGSGAGFRGFAEFPAIKSSFESYLIRSEDYSSLDQDNNGFADTNFNDVTQGILRWNLNRIARNDLVLYGVFRDDRNANGAGDGFETVQLYWSGLYVRGQIGSFTYLFHAIGNWGRFERPQRLESIGEPARLVVQDQLKRSGYVQDPDGRYLAPIDPGQNLYQEIARKEYRVNAGAGQLEAGYNLTNNLELSLQAAGASGRLGREPDNRPSFVRSDQFRSSVSSVQISRLAIDSSGGYTLFRGGQLTGLVEKGVLLRYRFENGLQLRLGYYHIELYRTPTMEYNRFHTRYPFYMRWELDSQGRPSLRREDQVFFFSHPGIRNDSNLVGDEINLSAVYRILGGLTLEGQAGYFRAGDGYRTLRDVQYGSYMAEASFSVRQVF